MSASFPQMAFWVIFPLAGLIVLTGWILIVVNAVKRLRFGKVHEGNEPISSSAPEYRDPLQPAWNPVDTATQDGTHYVPLP
ncbi:MAG: hypothetical protein ABSB41_02280 [Anaerolineales bacterium]